MSIPHPNRRRPIRPFRVALLATTAATTLAMIAGCAVSPQAVTDTLAQDQELVAQSRGTTATGPAPTPPPSGTEDSPGRADRTDTAKPECGTGMTPAGIEMFDSRPADRAPLPTYDLAVAIDPVAGTVDATMSAKIPEVVGDRLHFRVFPGMEAFEAGLAIDGVTVDGEPAPADLDVALLTVEVPAGTEGPVQVAMSFAYQIDQMAADENLLGSFSGSTLAPDTVGLLGLTESGMQLGHWFPVWLPSGVRTDPDPSGFGDIGAFPSADICASITAPSDYVVVTSGLRTAVDGDGTIHASGLGLRDFAMVVSNDLVERSQVVDGVNLRVWGPGDDPEALDTVLEHTVNAQIALVDAFGPYPWAELDVVSTPLGGGVGGMEWPGMVWVERSMFGGGIPGLGGVDSGMADMLAALGGPAITSMLEWTVAHELGHEWWHAVVGNDSIESPAVDEPLAQFAACLAIKRSHPEGWMDICEAQTTDQFAQALGLGLSDTVAAQPSDAFDNSLQYGAVVYGKAPGFYFEAAEVMGWDGLVDALESFVAEHAFSLVGTEVLRAHLVAAAGADGDTVDALWHRWFLDAKGAEDIEAIGMFDMLGGGGLNDLFGGGEGGIDLDELFGSGGGSGLNDLFGGGEGGIDLDELFGGEGGIDLDDLFGGEGGINLEDLFGGEGGINLEDLFGTGDGSLNLEDLFGTGDGSLDLEDLFGTGDGSLNLEDLFGTGDGSLNLEDLFGTGEGSLNLEDLFGTGEEDD